MNITGDVKIIRGQGMPSYRHHDFGNLYVKFDVKFPQSGFSDLAEIQKLHSILPPPQPRAVPPPDAMVEDFPLDTIDADQQARAHGRGAMDEDDDDVPAGAERMQCASQ